MPFLGYARILIATAVEPERSAVLAGTGEVPGVDVLAVGVGPAASAARTAQALARAEAAGTPYQAVISTGIAGGFTDRIAVGGLALSTRCAAADLGANSESGFLPLDALGFGTATCPIDPTLTARLAAALPHAIQGTVVTVSTVTGTTPGATDLRTREPTAIAEAMEGYGVGTATALWPTLPFAELRAISNPIGPRNRSTWQIPTALTTLQATFTTLRAISEASVPHL